MSWSEEQKAKGRETRRRNKEKREQELKDLKTQISTLNMELIEREAQIAELREMIANQGAEAASLGDASVEQVNSEAAGSDLAEKVIDGLMQRARDFLLSSNLHTQHNARTKLSKLDDKNPEPSTTVTVIGGGLHQTDPDSLYSLSVQKLNYVAAELGIAPCSQRDRLIEQIQEARQAK
tara:strand:+ start:470 stop:1006 length:537 start_codon:yes stop_codon:yes gene_type:complete